MKITRPKKKAAIVAELTLPEIDQIVGEIADYQLTADEMQASLDQVYRRLDEAKAALVATHQPELDRLHAARQPVLRGLEERLQIVEQWAQAHKLDQFEKRRSLKLLRGVIGFRLSPPKVAPLRGWTLARCAAALRAAVWGARFLNPPTINREALLKAHAEFGGHLDKLSEAGLQITQEDVFYVEPAETVSAAYAKEAA